jgi:hypothetical protein
MTEPPFHQTPRTRCPYCGHKLNAAGLPSGDAAPAPGDYSVCIACAGVLIFGDDLALRKPEPGELPTPLPADIVKVQRLVRMTKQ